MAHRDRVVALLLILAVGMDALVYDAPRASISEYYDDPYYDNNVRPIRVQRNSEVIVGEQTSKGVRKLLFECSAAYPLEWVYTGEEAPAIVTETGVKRNQGNSLSGDYASTLKINELTEAHTGNYTCRGLQNGSPSISYHLYVPGDRIFPAANNQNITFSSRDSLVRLPCSVSHPSAHVTIQRAYNGFVKCPLNNSVFFDPKKGFVLRVQELSEPQGDYVCTGSLDGNYKSVHFRLVSQFSPIRSACNPNPCGLNAECLLSRGRVVCTCISGYTGDPFVQCRRVIAGLDPCNPSPCGQYGDCVVRNGLAACTCRPGYQGKPPHCQSATTRCYSHQDCSPNEMCVEQECRSSCEGQETRCGRNAQCQIVNRTPICSCPPGYFGDGYQGCVPDSYNPPYAEVGEERLRPECGSDRECPSYMACIHQKCQNPCPSVCGPGAESCYVNEHKPVCNGGAQDNCRPGDPRCPHRGIGGCQRTNCGPHSECRDAGGQAVCSCLPGHTGTPPQCAPMCFGNSGCSRHLACQARKCQDPCIGHVCGVNAKCMVNNHKPKCQCLQGYRGDGKTGCSSAGGSTSLLTPRCPLQCARGSSCKLVGGTPTCSPNEQSCFSDTDCPTWLGCFNGQCKNPCEVFKTLCGENQECGVVNHKADCRCKPGFPVRINNDCFYQEDLKERSFDEAAAAERTFTRSGIPCEPPFCRQPGDSHRMEQHDHRCRFSGDCPSDKTCVNHRCTDLCFGACGMDAECRIEERGRSPKCYCPPGYFGSPKIRCYPLFRQQNDAGPEIVLLVPEGKEAEPTGMIGNETLLVEGMKSSDT